MYGPNLLTHIDWIHLPLEFQANYEAKNVKTMKKLRVNVLAVIEKAYEKYKKKANKNRRAK